ncbi:hypothetical protein HK098_004071 [Nowakowskiella sp. JEL0407]|nr:hypothetical protein HK098_004071 [Nowakowskiella sp. JEL0407]
MSSLPRRGRYNQRQLIQKLQALALYGGSELSRKSPHTILPGLYMGGVFDAVNAKRLRKIGITHIVNCSGGIFAEFFARGWPAWSENYDLDEDDDSIVEISNPCSIEIVITPATPTDEPIEIASPSLIPRRFSRKKNGSSYKKSTPPKYLVIDSSKMSMEDFRQCSIFIHATILSGGRCLVHSQTGVSRSSSFVMAYLIQMQKMHLDAAFELVRKFEPDAFPNKKAAELLLELHRRIHLFAKSDNPLELLGDEEFKSICLSALPKNENINFRDDEVASTSNVSNVSSNPESTVTSATSPNSTYLRDMLNPPTRRRTSNAFKLFTKSSKPDQPRDSAVDLNDVDENWNKENENSENENTGKKKKSLKRRVSDKLLYLKTKLKSS